MLPRGVRIAAMGHYVPEKVLTNADLEKMVDTSNEWIVSRTGIEERRIAAKDEATSDFVVKAARQALSRAEVSPEEIDLIIIATITPDTHLPATASVVQAELKASNAVAFDLVAACSGFLYALTVGSQFIQSGVYKNVLIAGAEVLSDFVNWKDRNTCILFGDGGGVALLQAAAPGEGLLASYMGSDGALRDYLKVPAGGSRLPPSLETLEKGQHFATMAGMEIFKLAVRKMGESLQRVLDQAQLTLEDVDFVVPHQANLRIIEAVRKRANLKKEQVIVNINRYGNMSAASIPVALSEAVNDGRIKRGDIVALVAFGAGLTWGANLFRW